MMRSDDPQDLADIAFLIRHDQIPSAQLESALAEAVIQILPNCAMPSSEPSLWCANWRSLEIVADDKERRSVLLL
jgi:hypothetical protein